MGCEFCHTVVLNADDLPTTALEQGGDGVPGRTMVLTNLPWTNISDSCRSLARKVRNRK